MDMRRFFQFAVLAVLFASLGIGCSHKKPISDDSSASNAAISETDLGSSDMDKAMGLRTVHFEYDSSLLSQEAKSALASNAEILKSNSSIRIQIEGHCDSRGGIQYNIALGERRGSSAKKYLQDLGVSGERINIISYGKERLLDMSNTENAHAKNRRANFVITSR